VNHLQDLEHRGHPPYPYYWQIPKNQITLLAAYYRGVRLAFLDLDEYLVFNKATGSSISTATCDSQPLLPAGTPAWNLLRFQSKSCNHKRDLQCWKEGSSLPIMANASLYMDMCSMSPKHGKHIVEADLVLNVKVHKVFPIPAAPSNTTNVSADCAFVIHLFSLVEARKQWLMRNVKTHYPMSQWQLPAADAGAAVVTPPPGHRLRLAPECRADGMDSASVVNNSRQPCAKRPSRSRLHSRVD
jgi:hypothetical protein